MSILRVEQDGVEFFTDEATGNCYMSESGLARLCGITQQGMRKKIHALLTTKSAPESLKEFAGKKVSRQLTLKINGLQVNVSLLPSDFCAAMIEHYAFEARNKTATALFSFRKFSRKGIDGWIQEITEWTGNAPREISNEELITLVDERKAPGTIAAEINPKSVIEMLQECNFTATGYRLYFYLEMKHLQNEKPTIAAICADLKMSRSSFRKWLPQVHDWSNCADWLEVPTRKGLEYEIQKRLHTELGGEMEVHTPFGPIDLVTQTEAIEIKRIEDWKEALGQIMAKAQSFPKLAKRIHLFGKSNKILKKILQACQPLNVLVTFEKALVAA
jgi:hypothetical protein